MISCLQIGDTADWMRAFRGRLARDRIPFTAHLELTARCSLRCRHCYLGDQAAHHAKRARERGADAIKKSIDEWAEAGSLHLVITGGDPMLRKDFPEIYRHAAEQGFFVTVFCDGMRVTDRVIELFHEFPPRSVETTIYGATAQTHDAITRVPGSHTRAWKGIQRLIDSGTRVFLKTVLMTLNQHELDAMAAQAETRGCKFRYDAAIFPCLPDRSAEPLTLRVTPEEAVKWDVTFPERRRRWKEAIQLSLEQPVDDKVYGCGAGNTAFYVDSFGNYSPCLMTTHYRYPPRGRPFRDIWRDDLSEIRRKKRTLPNGCLTGPLRGACTHCPAFNYLETGNEEIDSEYMRKTAELRFAAMMKA